MPLIGQLALALALMVAVYSIVANLLGIRRNSPDLLLSARHALWAMCAMVTVAVGRAMDRPSDQRFLAGVRSLIFQRYASDSVQVHGAMGRAARLAAVLDAGCSRFSPRSSIFQNRRRNPEITPWALIVLAGVAIFFLGMLNFVTRPFDLLATVPPDGSDLNPLLQNYWMAIHPPSLYTGYVSAAVPFAFACGALITRQARRRHGFAPRAAGRSSRGSFSRSAICSARAGPTRFSDGAATGRGTRSRTPPSCRGW